MPAPSIWRNRDFRLLLGGQLVSQLGNQVQSLALPLVVLAVTGSPTQAGLILGISTATHLLVGLVAGALIDRWDRRRTMVWCEVGRAALTASIPIAFARGVVTLPQLYLVAISTGILGVLFQAANSTALPNIVSPGQLPHALGATQAASSALGIAGSSAAGAAYAIGRAFPFAVNVLSYLASAATLSRIRVRFQEEDHGPATTGVHLVDDIREGLAWLWRQPVIRLLTVVEAADAVRYGAGYLLIIELARRVGSSPLEVGLVFTGAGTGGLAGGLLSGRLAARHRLGGVAIVMLWVEAVAFPLYAIAPSWGWLAAVAFLESLVAPIYSVAMDNYRLSITPDRVRGRVSSARGTLVTGAMSMGAMASGPLLAQFGAPALALGCSAWLLVLAIATSSSRTIRGAIGPSPADRTGDAEVENTVT